MRQEDYPPGTIVFAKLKGYPWWPARVSFLMGVFLVWEKKRFLLAFHMLLSTFLVPHTHSTPLERIVAVNLFWMESHTLSVTMALDHRRRKGGQWSSQVERRLEQNNTHWEASSRLFFLFFDTMPMLLILTCVARLKMRDKCQPRSWNKSPQSLSNQYGLYSSLVQETSKYSLEERIEQYGTSIIDRMW